MYLKKLELLNFRNIEQGKVEFDPKANILFGQNGQGKTSILEAIYLLSISRSFRAKSEKNYLMHAAEYCDIQGDFLSGNRDDIQLRLYFSLLEGKHLFLNGNRLQKYSDIIGLTPVVLLSLEDLSLTFGMPAVRRRFMDILLAQVDPVYLTALQNYKRILAQRNKLLSLIAGRSESPRELVVWDEQLAEAGSILIFSRNKLVQFMRDNISRYYRELSDNQEEIDIQYSASILDETRVFKKEEIRDKFRAVLQDNLQNDIKRESTLKGPHRDDLRFLKNGLLIKQFASQGENKTFLIALKFLESDYLQKKLNESPLLLLDDIFGELDEYRINHLIDHILNFGQSFITTTLRSKFAASGLSGSNYLQIENGVLLQ